jgi:hypothetical protein
VLEHTLALQMTISSIFSSSSSSYNFECLELSNLISSILHLPNFLLKFVSYTDSKGKKPFLQAQRESSCNRPTKDKWGPGTSKGSVFLFLNYCFVLFCFWLIFFLRLQKLSLIWFPKLFYFVEDFLFAFIYESLHFFDLIWFLLTVCPF